MILTRERYLDTITERLSVLVSYVSLKNSLQRFDINHAAEDFYAEFLNLIYGYELENANNVTPDITAIDLVDKTNRLAIQVTSNTSSDKVKDTLRSCQKKEYYKSIDRLIILIITNKKDHKRAYANLPDAGIPFDPNTDIWDCSDIIHDISSLKKSVEQLKSIAEFLETNIALAQSPDKEQGKVFDNISNVNLNMNNEDIINCCPINRGICNQFDRIKREYDDNKVFLNTPCNEEYEDFESQIVQVIKSKKMIPIQIQDSSSITNFCRVCQFIQTCNYGVTDISSEDEGIMLVLGMLYGMNRKCAILRKRNATIPTNLRGKEYIDYANVRELKSKLTKWLNDNTKPE